MSAGSWQGDGYLVVLGGPKHQVTRNGQGSFGNGRAACADAWSKKLKESNSRFGGPSLHCSVISEKSLSGCRPQQTVQGMEALARARNGAGAA